MNTVLVKIKNGDHKAFKCLFESYHYKIYQFAFRFTNDDAAAEDIVQNIFIHIWFNRTKLNEQAGLEAILFKTAKQEVSNWYRNMKSQELRIEDAGLLAQEDTEEEDQYKEVQKAYLYELLETLPEKRKKIFMLHRFEGLTCQEIAQHLSISKSAVENQINQALTYLRQKVRSAKPF
ncbi:MAG: sigma-70 family RNA polymerase sigma factor [Candidatus Pedobacter colombiensis]|uniref:Sigma-70 family RNA polymerase sigma factor n=1 Tax=Candidatus Pedobacter colombiensis TaxID=3121371 RepID=A0AAJ5WDM8_9SPHI|nr:sigma-70 family RNA polymerase sigma factor [Pedobacter sp.]WEK21595.1 MAG: sigma-70 family RNA polymerase sigma factor [Pedobacter sp.]